MTQLGSLKNANGLPVVTDVKAKHLLFRLYKSIKEFKNLLMVPSFSVDLNVGFEFKVV